MSGLIREYMYMGMSWNRQVSAGYRKQWSDYLIVKPKIKR